MKKYQIEGTHVLTLKEVSTIGPATSAAEFAGRFEPNPTSITGCAWPSEPVYVPDGSEWSCERSYPDGSGSKFTALGTDTPLSISSGEDFWTGSGTVKVERGDEKHKYSVRRSDKLSPMVGHTMSRISGSVGEFELSFESVDGSAFIFFNPENGSMNDVSVTVEDIVGDLSDLIGSPIVEAEEVSSDNEGLDPSCTWTFYRFSTVKGTVTVRWCGQSNGYYSEEVQMRIVQPVKP